MAKKSLNIIAAFTWLSNCLDTQNLSASEQLVLLHLVKFLNRNFWKATTLSQHMLAKAIGKDDRTVKTALKKLTEKGLVIQSGGEIHIGIEGAEKYFSDSSRSKKSKSESEPESESESKSESEQNGRIRTLADYLG